ncbi:hypothetical protein PF005_g20021 [Phytophthora fragariae]|uniref:Beta/gamma crystallin 'Greek key' domain-containing protein n=1 Tax=Phytophthora fragariae TaxID=53985 RepID=A0A6A3E4R5_9STRA|nr:hypothetical protein PF003_g17034 [Phytophthora fragariae]KAE8927436.1 hypothetical protein PF009_g22394 [Phytophthora fragariae]KAE8989087.1 hypothetical protein PF011_g18916 [Phytophthora fragariae]KAE9086164.1 hypothetical protein PF010_g20188 [Phytophthora fragariae]KAE9088191.1 hypothetical protein PF007_g20072 [Phytophthora fragariae]
MSFLKSLVAAVVIAFTISPSVVQAWEGVVILYEKTHFNGQSFPWFINAAQKCYDLSCFNDKVTSIKWQGLPQKGKFNGKAHIAFYKNAGCTGHHLEWTTEEKNYPIDLTLDNRGRNK